MTQTNNSSDNSGSASRLSAATAALAASTRSDIASFMVMDVMNAAAAREASGQRVIHMEVGQPGTQAPSTARRAAIAAVESESLGYTLALGAPALRERIAQHYDETYGLRLSPNRVVVTNGSSAGFILTFLLLFETGDRVALPSPGYPCYRNILRALGQDYAVLETSNDNRWMPTAAQLETEQDIRGLLIASPNNPTGTMIEPDRLAALSQACSERGIWLISDEIYHGLTYTQPASCALAVNDDAIVINSFSKYFSMTGWRVGWIIVPDRLIAAAERLAQNLFICAPAVSQAAALGAFDAGDELEANVATYRANRETLLAGLPQVGFDRLVPADGAFYLYADVSAYTDDSLAFSRDMLNETGVAATSGYDFDETRGNRFMRFSYAGTPADMTEALERLGTWSRLKG